MNEQPRAVPFRFGTRPVGLGESGPDAARPKLESLQRIASIVNSSFDLPRVLRLIVDAVCDYSTFTGCDLIAIDETAGVSRLAARDSGAVDAERGASWPLAVSSSLLAIRSGQPHVVRGDDRVPEVSPDTPYRRRPDYSTALIVPLSFEGFPAAIWVYSREPHQFSDMEVEWARSVANLASIALRNAELFERERRSAEQREAIIRNQTRLMQGVLAGGTLQATLDSIAEVLGGPTIFVHQGGQQPLLSAGAAALLAEPPGRSEGSGARHALAEETLRQLTSRLPRSNAAFELELAPASPSGPGFALLGVAVFVGGREHGCLAVLGDGRAFDDIDRLAIEQAGLALAVELMREVVRLETETQLRTDLLRDLFGGPPADWGGLVARAELLGIDLTGPVELLLATPVDDPVGDGRALRERLDELNRALAVWSPGAVAVTDRGALVVLAPAGPRGRSTRGLGERIGESLAETAGPDWLVVHGALCTRPVDFGRARRELAEASAALRRFGRRGVVDLDELGVYRAFLGSVDPAGLTAFVDDLLGPLRSYREGRQLDLLHTLEVFLDANGNLQQTARLLAVHISTLRYRLRRIERVTGRDLGAAESRLALHLALRVRRLIEASAEGPPGG